MNILQSSIGIIVILLVIFVAFEYGRKMENDHHSRAEAYAKACVREYQNHVTNTYYVSEAQHRWMASVAPPQLPAISVAEQGSLTKPAQYRPADDPAFVQALHDNGRATVWVEPNERKF